MLQNQNLPFRAGEGTVQPLTRRSLAEQVADELRNLILLEKLSPGASIHEREMADALGVSRTPLRESLRLLASEGLIDISPNRAPVVANPSLSDLKQLLQVQGALEALAGELACASATDAELDSLVSMEQEMQAISETAEPLDFFLRDMAFHSRIVAASGNSALVETHYNYNARLWRARFISSRRRVNRKGTLEQHSAIVSGLVARKPKATSEALKNHLDTGFENIQKALRENDTGKQE